MKRNYLKELKYNPPWKLILAIIDFIQWNPFNRKTMYLGKYIRTCLHCTWKVNKGV